MESHNNRSQRLSCIYIVYIPRLISYFFYQNCWWVSWQAVSRNTPYGHCLHQASLHHWTAWGHALKGMSFILYSFAFWVPIGPQLSMQMRFIPLEAPHVTLQNVPDVHVSRIHHFPGLPLMYHDLALRDSFLNLLSQSDGKFGGIRLYLVFFTVIRWETSRKPPHWAGSKKHPMK